VRRTYQESPNEYQRAITSVFSGIPDDDMLRRSFPEVQRRLMSEYGGNDALDTWLNAPANLMSIGPEGQRQQEQIRRVLRLAGMRQQPITPMSRGLSAAQRGLSLITAPLSMWGD
jgi:hypothetical protein